MHSAEDEAAFTSALDKTPSPTMAMQKPKRPGK
jgi:hypothetical protein